MEKERIAIFIDGNNLYHLVKKMFQNHIKIMNFSFKKFIKKITKNRNLVRTYYYNAPLDWKKDKQSYAKQQKFFTKLQKIPNFKLVLCRMQKVKTGGEIIYQIKEDDIHLAVDMVKLAYNNAYDTAILVSSDGDFVPAIQTVQQIGKKVENIGFETKFSHHLKQECDKFTLIKKYQVIEMIDDFKVSPK